MRQILEFIKRYVFFVLLILSLVGLADALFLTYEHYNPLAIPPCPVNAVVDCGKVIRSVYALIYGVPLGLLGTIYYLFFLIFLLLNLSKKYSSIAKVLMILASVAAFLFSIYLVFIQIFVIRAICFYCMISAVTSTSIFLIVITQLEDERKLIAIKITGFIYQNLLKKLFFLVDAETVHENMLNAGEYSGKNRFLKNITKWLFVKKSVIISQKLLGINFNYPIGLAAGFDYEAKLTQFLPYLGFGYATVGTITNLEYEGNPKPRLGRLPKSKSLLVNKGFKNEGAEVIAQKLSKLKFEYVQGISIGRSNSDKLISQRDSINDIVKSFKTFENNKVRNSYYELNISCPNLIHGSVDFYSPKKLNDLLTAVDKLKLKKPLFIKMPIEKTDKETLSMLKVISDHSPKGVIFGNLQKDRKHPSLIKAEVKKFKMGFFSGKPTYQRSNELIKLAYKKYKNRFTIIGTGGIFSADDAYTKIKLGASLVQLITGLIYQGPQLVSEINFGLTELLKRDGYKHISEAVGVDAK